MQGVSGERSWLGRYRALFPIRARGAFHIMAAERVDGAGPRVIVAGGPHVDRAGVASALAEVARVHALVEHELVPRAELCVHDGATFVELACEAITDGHEIVRMTAESGRRLEYGAADALFTQMRIALQAAHAVVDPTTGSPVCLGRLSLGNMLFARDGTMSVVGLGHNFPVARENGELDGTCTVFQAPEVGLGGAPSPEGDYVAILLASRSLVTFADMKAIADVVLERGVLRRDNLELLALVRSFETQWISQLPGRRPTVDEGVRASARLREILGTTIDIEGLEAFVARLLDEQQPQIELGDDVRDAARARGAYVISRDGSWAEANGERHRLGRAHGRILVSLAERATREPGRELRVWDLLAAGWPGEEPVPEAGANRVYVALTRLRKLGFDAVLQRHGDGYRVDPEANVRFA